jgi:hypothetical protein
MIQELYVLKVRKGTYVEVHAESKHEECKEDDKDKDNQGCEDQRDNGRGPLLWQSLCFMVNRHGGVNWN